VLSQTVKFGQTITQFMDALPVQHATPELRIDCPDTLKFGVMDKIQNKVTAAYAAADISVIDGVRVRSQGGWWLLRASNTEAALVARAEAETPETLASLIGEITATLKAAGLDWTFA
jgi:phosphomannomutase